MISRTLIHLQDAPHGCFGFNPVAGLVEGQGKLQVKIRIIRFRLAPVPESGDLSLQFNSAVGRPPVNAMVYSPGPSEAIWRVADCPTMGAVTSPDMGTVCAPAACDQLAVGTFWAIGTVCDCPDCDQAR